VIGRAELVGWGRDFKERDRWLRCGDVSLLCREEVPVCLWTSLSFSTRGFLWLGRKHVSHPSFVSKCGPCEFVNLLFLKILGSFYIFFRGRIAKVTYCVRTAHLIPHDLPSSESYIIFLVAGNCCAFTNMVKLGQVRRWTKI
jgi:hypothetical protein